MISDPIIEEVQAMTNSTSKPTCCTVLKLARAQKKIKRQSALMLKERRCRYLDEYRYTLRKSWSPDTSDSNYVYESNHLVHQAQNPHISSTEAAQPDLNSLSKPPTLENCVRKVPPPRLLQTSPSKLKPKTKKESSEKGKRWNIN